MVKMAARDVELFQRVFSPEISLLKHQAAAGS